MADDISANRSVTRMLELLKMEFPDYVTDNDQMIAAAVAMAHVCGAIGAIVLLKGGEARLDKMVKMIARNIENTAQEGARAVGMDIKRKLQS